MGNSEDSKLRRNQYNAYWKGWIGGAGIRQVSEREFDDDLRPLYLEGLRAGKLARKDMEDRISERFGHTPRKNIFLDRGYSYGLRIFNFQNRRTSVCNHSEEQERTGRGGNRLSTANNYTPPRGGTTELGKRSLCSLRVSL